MNVKKALQIQQVLDGKAIPMDMFDEHLVYYSKSRDRWINIIDMDICQLVRSFAKVYNEMNYYVWRDMSDTELKSCGQPVYNSIQAQSIFRKLWGWKSTQKALSM